VEDPAGIGWFLHVALRSLLLMFGFLFGVFFLNPPQSLWSAEELTFCVFTPDFPIVLLIPFSRALRIFTFLLSPPLSGTPRIAGSFLL